MSRLTVKKDDVAKILKSIAALTEKSVLVGIPESEATRDDDAPANNATLGYIHEHGSPANNIPARPHLIPGIEDAQEAIANRFKKAAQAAMNGKEDKVRKQLESAGLVAQNSVKNKITDGDFAPLSPVTIRMRHLSRETKSLRKSEKKYLSLLEAGILDYGASLKDLQDASGIKPLVNTGQYRNSITYVIRKK